VVAAAKIWFAVGLALFLFRGNADTSLRASKRIDLVFSTVFNLAMQSLRRQNHVNGDATNSAAPLSQHLREFASRPGAWVVLARNMILSSHLSFVCVRCVAVFNYGSRLNRTWLPIVAR